MKIPDIPVLVISLYDSTGSEMDSGDITRLNVTPSMATAGFNSTGMSVKVGTSSTAGYKLNMSVANSGQLVSGTNFIAPLPENTDENNPYSCTVATASDCNFTVNSWGYWMTGQTANTYLPIPTTETNLVNYTAGATDEDTTDFAFGVRANAKQPGGDYETTINFIATANPETTIHSLQYMQDFNVLVPDEYAAVVESMKEDESYELVDSRDNKTYNVAKLKGGNVWLQDNLSLDLVNVSLADLQGNTNASNETLDKLKNGGGSSPYTTAKVIETSSFGASGDAYTRPKINSSYGGYNKDSEWLYDGANKGKQGIYYNYCAASAGSYCYASGNPSSDPDTSTLIDAKEDICPAGWRMPTGGDNGEYQNLCTAAWGQSCTNGMDMSYSDAKSIQSVLHAPLSGNFYNNSTIGQGSNGRFWSSTYYDGNNMYYLSVNSSKSWAQNNSNRYYGFSVRCVLKENENNVAINFNGNGATSGENRTLGYKAGSVTLPSVDAAGFEKTGRYGFAGWNTAANGSGTTYTAGTTITAEMNGLTLYAQWQEATIAMQDLTYAACPATPTYVYDNRDDSVYVVKRLADNRCWMLDNLALGSADTTYTLTSTDSNVTTDFTLPKSANTGFTSYDNAMINTDYKNTVPNKVYGTEGSGKIGVYYNYAAASAGKITGSSNSSNGDANQDICPKNWRLPTGGSSGGFQTLCTAVKGSSCSNGETNSNALKLRDVLNTPLSGYFYDSSAGGQGAGGYGYFWSSTRYDNTYMYGLYVSEPSVYSQNYRGRSNGFSVRCVLKATS